MRRLIALILMLVVPLQFAWSAALGLHGHPSGGASSVHAHDHDFHDAGYVGHDLALFSGADSDPASNSSHDDDGHHFSHCHHVFSLILLEPGLALGRTQAGCAPPPLYARFTSHTPLLPDPPPVALA